jgi:hypothetical protein
MAPLGKLVENEEIHSAFGDFILATIPGVTKHEEAVSVQSPIRDTKA